MEPIVRIRFDRAGFGTDRQISNFNFAKAGGGSRPAWTPPGKRLRRDAYGPDRTNRCPKLTSKGHTDLRSCISEAKFVKESDFDVKSRLAPPKSTEIDEKHFSDTKIFSNFNFSNFNFAKFFEKTDERTTNEEQKKRQKVLRSVVRV